MNPKIKYHSFRAQFKYCHDNDYILHDTCSFCGRKEQSCLPLGGLCKSSKCKVEREKIEK